MEITPQRKQAVGNAKSAWIKRLIDLSRRNNLLYYRSLKWGTLNLSFKNTERWADLLRGETVGLRALVEGLTEEELAHKALAVWRRAQENQEEKGLATMFVALGMAEWKAGDEGRNADAPVLLLPVSLEIKGHAGTSVSLKRTGSIQINLVLLHVLAAEFGIPIESGEAIALLKGDDEDEAFDPEPVYSLFRQSCGEVPEFAVRNSAVLGNFAFQKMAMVRDLQENQAGLEASDLIAALAGDTNAKEILTAKQQEADPREFDNVPPEQEFLILDADSSQQAAINSVIAGQSAVIHGPPGTGKSQTIANLVACLAATGKSILFVAEKRAALQVVQKRLQQAGLEKLAIDLHGADVSCKRVMDQVAESLLTVRQATAVDCEGLHQRYVERRQRLNRHVASLHKKRSPGGFSVYELQGRLLRLPEGVHTATRWRNPELTKIAQAAPERVRDWLAEAAGHASLFLRNDSSPWNGVTIPDGATAQNTMDLVSRLCKESWPRFLEMLAATTGTVSFRSPNTLNEAQAVYALWSSVKMTLEKYSPEVFARDIQAMIASLSPGANGGLPAIWNWCTNSKYRQARKLALGFRTAGKEGSKQLSAELRMAEVQREEWAKWSQSKSLPQRVDDQAGRRALEQALQEVAALEQIVPLGARSQPLSEVTARLEALAKDRLTPMKLPKVFSLEKQLAGAGVGLLVEELRKKAISPELWIPTFDQCWYASSIEAAQAEDPELASFQGRTHDGFVSEFKELDRQRIRIAAARVRRAYAERAIGVMNKDKAQEHLIRSEAEKKRKHKPLRELFARAGDVLTAICPCWMASPLSVSQLLDASRKFDFVVFDEASQVLPEDAIPSVLRGRQLVIAGDSWQLPPTTFFASSEIDELAEDESSVAVEGFESLLDTTNAFLPSRYLDWHYRSRDETLISFSNHHIYKDRLVTFPGPGGSPAIQHVLVAQGNPRDWDAESTSAEVAKVVELILKHAEERRNESLGVIAMGIRHADRVQAALDQALARQPHLAPFFDAATEERFFVKNLERVQGDERDAIILTIGYGKDAQGNLPFRFGPILSAGGRRRLNVAVTRARKRMTLVSSFSHLDMDPSRVKSGTGVEMLRDYLEYAASGGKRLGSVAMESFPMNSFEAEVFDVLTQKGMRLISQVGASSYRIDLVAQHPKKPGQFVLAIECDGASYHSSATARDRDRLRQQQLENLGWKFHRIWSTDWFQRKEEEIARAMMAYEKALSEFDRPTAGKKETRAEEQPVAATIQPADARLTAKRPGTRPLILLYDSIDEYRQSELLRMIEWIDSDGQLRTDEEFIELLVPELGFQRRGSRIDETLKAALERYRSESKNRRQN